MFDDTVNLGSNDLAITIMRDNIIDHQNTDAKVPAITVHDNIRHPNTEARDEVTDNLQDDWTQPRRSTVFKCVN